RVVSLRVVLRLDDYPPGSVPTARRVAERAEQPLRLAGHVEAGRCRVRPGTGQPLEHGVARQARDVAGAVAVTPAHQPPAPETPVSTEDDAEAGPGRAQASDQQFQDGAAVPGGVAVGGPQVGDQELLAAEDVQRQKAVAAVVAVEEAALLPAVDGV